MAKNNKAFAPYNFIIKNWLKIALVFSIPSLIVYFNFFNSSRNANVQNGNGLVVQFLGDNVKVRDIIIPPKNRPLSKQEIESLAKSFGGVMKKINRDQEQVENNKSKILDNISPLLKSKLKEINPTSVDLGKSSNYSLAEAYYELALREKDDIPSKDAPSIVLYKKAIEFRPDYAEAYNNMGYLYLRHNNFSKAISGFQSAIKFKPDSSLYYYNLACAYAKRCSSELDRERAINALTEAVGKGYDYYDHFQGDKDLDCLRNDPKYRPIYESLLEDIRK